MGSARASILGLMQGALNIAQIPMGLALEPSPSMVLEADQVEKSAWNYISLEFIIVRGKALGLRIRRCTKKRLKC